MPHDRVVDHRANHQENSVEKVLTAEFFDSIVDALANYERDLRMQDFEKVR